MRCPVPYVLVVLLVAGLASGSTITVRKDGTGDFTVIQQALNVAVAGDTILIGPGEYLDRTWIRFPAWSHDIESYANVTVDNLTIIGAGSGQTLIGPATYVNASSSPIVMTYVGGSDFRLEGVCLRNSSCGLYMSGRLFLDQCMLFNNGTNLAWFAVGNGGWIRDSQFDVVTPLYPESIRIMNYGGAADIMVEDCTVQHSMTLVDGVNGVEFRGCTLANSMSTVHVYGGARVHISASTVTSSLKNAVSLTSGNGSVCVIDDSEISGGQAALASLWTDCRFEVTHSRLTGGSYAVMYTEDSAGASVITGCDLVKGGGIVFRALYSSVPVTHDFRNNYWGTSSAADIQSWIIDHNDNPSLGATVLYTPFAGQSVPSETTTWGDLKALYR